MVNKKSAEFPIDKRNCFFKLFICRFFCVSLCLSHMNVFVHIYVCCVFLYKCTSSLHQFFLEFFRCFCEWTHFLEIFIFHHILLSYVYACRLSSQPPVSLLLVPLINIDWNDITVNEMLYAFGRVCMCVCADNFLFHRHRLFVRRCVDVDIYMKDLTLCQFISNGKLVELSVTFVVDPFWCIQRSYTYTLTVNTLLHSLMPIWYDAIDWNHTKLWCTLLFQSFDFVYWKFLEIKRKP